MEFLGNFEVVFQLFLAVFLGACIGLEREYKRKEAGLRTYSLVCLGACLLTMVAFEMFENFRSYEGVSFDPARIVQAIAIGIGFIGAGVIFKHPSFGAIGLTTAAGLWVAAGVGISIAAGLYLLAFWATCLSVLILAGLRSVKEKTINKNRSD